MADFTSKQPLMAIGIDVGDQYSQICVLDESGTTIEEARILTKAEAFEKRFRRADALRIAIEVGSHSPWLSRLLEGLGHEVVVANARKLRLIYENDSKSDRVDAEYLARLARLDPKLLCPIRHRGKQAQADRALIRARDVLVRSRTALINTARGVAKSFGMRLPKCTAEAFPKQAAPRVAPELQPALSPLLDAIVAVNRAIREHDKRIEATAAERYAAVEIIGQVPGVGTLTALAFVLTIGDPSRFNSSRAVGSYVGLRPRKDASSGSDPELRITKAGDSAVRRLLVQAAQYTLGPFGPDTDLRRWGLALADRGGKSAKKRAVIAIARKLAVLLHRLWVTGEVYEPLRQASVEARRKMQ